MLPVQQTSHTDAFSAFCDDLLMSQWRRVDLLVQRAVLRLTANTASDEDRYHGLAVSAQEAEALIERPLGTGGAFAPSLTDEEENVFADVLARETAVGHQVAGEGQSNWAHLLETFALDDFEADAFLLCLLPDLDLRYQRLYGFLQDDVTKRYPNVDLLLTLKGAEGPERLGLLGYFAPEARLIRYRLLDQLGEKDGGDRLDAAYRVPASVRTWLLGNYRPDEAIGEIVECLKTDAKTGAKVSISLDTALKNLHNGAGSSPLLVFYGDDTSAQRESAIVLAANQGMGVLSIDMDLLAQAIDPGELLKRALRDARMLNTLPLIENLDACFEDDRPAVWAGNALAFFEEIIVTSGRERWYPSGSMHVRPILHVEFDLPGYQQRLQLWQEALDVDKDDDILDQAAAQFVLSSGQIRDAAHTAQDIARARGEQITRPDLFSAARAHSHHHLAKLARHIDPRYSWEDIILPNEQRDMLREVVSAVRGKARVMEVWGVGKKLVSSQGITVLFAGPPGTGKTMAAEVIAGELGLDLYKIDLSTVVSKYIGETEKNLEQIFSEAQTSNAVLFFDEADAIFGKRSEVKEANDRYANIETSYLLQRMDSYDGITILATNLRANVDEAFTRRVQFAIDFYMPDEEHRLRIWETLFPSSVPRDDDVDLPFLAKRFKLAGGNIRNIIVSAVYQAAAIDGSVTMKYLLHGTRRELQKMGRLVNEQDLLHTSTTAR